MRVVVSAPARPPRVSSGWRQPLPRPFEVLPGRSGKALNYNPIRSDVPEDPATAIQSVNSELTGLLVGNARHRLGQQLRAGELADARQRLRLPASAESCR